MLCCLQWLQNSIDQMNWINSGTFSCDQFRRKLSQYDGLSSMNLMVDTHLKMSKNSRYSTEYWYRAWTNDVKSSCDRGILSIFATSIYRPVRRWKPCYIYSFGLLKCLQLYWEEVFYPFTSSRKWDWIFKSNYIEGNYIGKRIREYA